MSLSHPFGKSVFEYDNYRLYLKDVYESEKAKDPAFSHREFARLIGSGSSGIISMLVKGKRLISEVVAEKIAQGLELKRDESSYFKSLVFLNQATIPEERQFWARAVMKSKGYRRVNPLAEPLYHYWTKWYFVAIRELVTTVDFREDSQWISGRLEGKVSPEEASKAIEELLLLGFLKRNPDSSKLEAHETVVSADEVTSPFMAEFHAQMIRLAADAIYAFPREVREISGITFSIGEAGLNRMKTMLQEYRKEMLQFVIQEKDAKAVYQMNIQFYPLAPFAKMPKG